MGSHAESIMADAIFNSEEFLGRLRALDNGAWRLLLTELRKRLKDYYKAIGLSYEADDLISKTIVRLLDSKFIKYDRTQSSVLTWAVNTGKLIAREHFTKHTRQQKLLSEYEMMIVPETSPQEKKSGESRLEALMKRALESLSKNEGLIISLRLVEGLSFELIAETLEISQNTARVRLTRARQKLTLEFERLCSRGSRKRIDRSRRRHPDTPAPTPLGERPQIA
jgi:RNA polymerase sigma-70 factor, ECF subfamily